MGTPRAIAEDDKFIVVFDGVCNLCTASVQFIIKRDSKHRFKFCSFQSNFAQEILSDHSINFIEPESILLITKQGILYESDAALTIARHLSGAWPMLYVFKILPRFIRDSIYKWIARNRYRFFGKKNACWIPTPELRGRFLD